MSVAVRCGGAQYRNPFLGAICHSHVWDGSARRIKNNTLDSLSRLEFFNDNKFSNCPRRSDEECAYKRDGYRPIHETIIGYQLPSRQGTAQMSRVSRSTWKMRQSFCFIGLVSGERGVFIGLVSGERGV